MMIFRIRALCVAFAAVALPGVPAAVTAQDEHPQYHLYDVEDFGVHTHEVTFNKDIAPILARSCVSCHRAGGAAPVAFTSYRTVRRYATRIREKTAIRDRMGAMPPWYAEKDIGIQHYLQDPSLSDRDLALIQAWVDNGVPEGAPEDLTVDLEGSAEEGWLIEPDLVVESGEIFLEGGAPDWWGEIEPIAIPLQKDRYVKSLQIREINDVPREGTGRETVGGLWIVHHLIYRTEIPTGSLSDIVSWPVHEVGRNPDFFDEDAAPLLKVGSQIASESAHLHSTGIDTRARLQFGFEFYPEDYEPEYRRAGLALGDGLNISVTPLKDDQELHAYEVLQQHTKIISFEPHLHAQGDRMCLEAIWDDMIETLSCVGYDHNWVRTYSFADNYEPLLPKGTILHIIGYMDNTEANFNVPDPRNWQGSGNRSITNMFIDLGMRVAMTDEQFVDAMIERREVFDVGPNDHVIGCPLCLANIPVLEEETEEPAGELRESSQASAAGARNEE
jgi:hypothetical protein